MGRPADADDGHGRVKEVNPGELAERVIAVKLEYGLSVDARERGTCQRPCSPAVPAVELQGRGHHVVDGGLETETFAVGNGSASELQGNNASYTATDRAHGLGNRDGGHRGRGSAGTVPATRPRRPCSSRSSWIWRRCRLYRWLARSRVTELLLVRGARRTAS